MSSLACALKPSGLTLGRPPCSFLPSLRDVVSMVPNLIISLTEQEQRFLRPMVPNSWQVLKTVEIVF
jgi:hypothetical protein